MDTNKWKFDKVLLSTKWANKYIPYFVINDNDDENEDENENEDDENGDDITTAPGIITLKKREMLKDNNGNIIEIEVRGTRDYDNCYFYVRDVAKGFGMKKLYDAVLHKNGNYTNMVDYKYFYLNKNTLNSDKNKKVKKIFLTYTGLLRVLFVSRNKTVGKFIGWATKTLFTAHLGTTEQKNVLASKLMGISTDIVKEVFNKTSSTLPTIYLVSIGKVFASPKGLSQSPVG